MHDKPGLRLAGLLILICLSIFPGSRVALAADEGCERTDVSEVSSPDDHWVARIYGKLCDLGITSSAAVLVDLVRAQVPDTPVTVLSIDMPSNKGLWPRAKWEGAGRIVLELPSNANIALQMANFQNIDIQVRFCTGDPTERDRWLAYRAAYHKWIADMTAWTQARSRDPGTAGPQPRAPTPPGTRAVDPSCLPP